jgi:cytochrome c oxidase assembly protein subunit 15
MATSSIPTRVTIRTKTPSASLVRFSWIALGFMVLLVLEGAVVRATSSGGGCGNHWPLCNGDFFPHHPRLATVIEYTHRSLTGICTTLVVVLAGWTFLGTSPKHKARRAVVASCLLLVTEALLGAVLVLRGYVENNVSPGRVIMQSVHFTNTMLLLAALTLTAWFLRQSREAGPAVLHSPEIKSATLLAVLATIVMGATGSLAALADTLFPSVSLRAAFDADFASASPLLVRMRWMHPAASMIGFLCVLLLARLSRTKLSRLVLLLFCAQIVLGIADVVLLAPTWMQLVHLLGADLYWVALVALAGEILWPTAIGQNEQYPSITGESLVSR